METDSLTLEQLWRALECIRKVSFEAKSLALTGWDGVGTGDVRVERPSKDAILFYESGVWQPDEGQTTRFRNVFRWSRMEDSVSLEHLRFGPSAPVYLFDLAPQPDGTWKETEAHLCGDDRYSASLSLQESGLDLCWTVVGPKKHETLRYRYSFA